MKKILFIFIILMATKVNAQDVQLLIPKTSIENSILTLLDARAASFSSYTSGFGVDMYNVKLNYSSSHPLIVNLIPPNRYRIQCGIVAKANIDYVAEDFQISGEGDITLEGVLSAEGSQGEITLYGSADAVINVTGVPGFVLDMINANQFTVNLPSFRLATYVYALPYIPLNYFTTNYPTISISNDNVILGLSTPMNNLVVDQRAEDGSRINDSQISYWNGSGFAIYTVPANFNLPINTSQTFRAYQQLLLNPSQKYNSWYHSNNIINHRSFFLDGQISRINIDFKKTYSGVTIQNLLDGNTIAGINIYFKDPWLIDYSDPNFGNSKRNQGVSAPFISRTSPFNPDFSTSYGGNIYQGVFLNENQSFDPSKPIYSVRIPLTQNIYLSQTGKTHKFYFQNWGTSNALLQQIGNNPEGYDQKAVVFTSGNAEINANYKGTQLSNDALAFSNYSQRKLIETKTGTTTWLHQVYTSIGHVWIEHSSDGGNSWILGNNNQPLDGTTGGKNPSIAYTYDSWGNYNYIGVVWQQPYSSTYKIQGMIFNQYAGLSNVPSPVTYVTTLHTEPSDAYSVNANPNLVLAGGAFGPYIVTFERKSTSGSWQPGINWLVGNITDSGTALDGPFGNVESNGILNGTNASTINTQISRDPGADGSNQLGVNFIRQQGSPGLIYSHYLYLIKSGNWQYIQNDDGMISYNASVNSSPSITTLPSYIYGATWIEYGQMVYYSLNYLVRYYYGSSVQSCSINRGGGSSNGGFVVWSQNSPSWINKSIRFDNGSPVSASISTLSTTGKYLQAGNELC